MSEELKEKIMKRVRIDPETGCWNWMGPVNCNGSAIIQYCGKQIFVKRFCFSHFVGEIFVKNVNVASSCGLKSCINPDHVILKKSGQAHEKKSVCKNGHNIEDDKDVYIIKKTNARVCKICTQEKNLKYRLKNKKQEK